MKGKRKSVRFGENMPPNSGSPTGPINLVSKFAGEAFGTDNVRTVFASASQDNVEREDRVILLIGPAGTGKSTLIDCMCNYFYGAELKSKTRYKIADEIFDQTTPIKTIIKYVFNETKMPYRPIVIDTPGIGSASGIQTEAEISQMLSSFLSQSHRVVIHAIGFVLKYSDSRISLKSETQIREILSMFPKWMMPNVVPLLSSSDGTATIPLPIATLFSHLGLTNNKVFFFNSGSLFDVSEAEALTEQLRTTYWTITMTGLDDFFEHVAQLNPQCIAEELPPLKSPPPTFVKQYSSDIHTPSHTPPPPPAASSAAKIVENIEKSSGKDMNTSTSWSTNVHQKGVSSGSTSLKTSATTRTSTDNDSVNAIYSKIRKISEDTKSSSDQRARERIIPIKLLHDSSKTSVKVDDNQVNEARQTFSNTSLTQQLSTGQHGTTKLQSQDIGGGASMKRYTYDPSSMSHKEFIVKGPNITTGEGIALAKDGTTVVFGGTPIGGVSLERPQRMTETIINDIPMENLVHSGSYTHLKSSPPPAYTPEQIPQRTPLATLAGVEQQQQQSHSAQKRTSTSVIDVEGDDVTSPLSRNSPLRKRLSSRDSATLTPTSPQRTAISASSDMAFKTANDANMKSFDSSMQRSDKYAGQIASFDQKDHNDFIITQEMKKSRSPILVHVTMGQKDKTLLKFDDTKQSETFIDTKIPMETNIDDIAPPEYDVQWSSTKSAMADVVTGNAYSYGYHGNATAIATSSAPGQLQKEESRQQKAQSEQMMRTAAIEADSKSWTYAGQSVKTAALTSAGGTVVENALQQTQNVYVDGGNIGKRSSAHGFDSLQQTTNTTTDAIARPASAVISASRYSGENTYRGQTVASAQRVAAAYGVDDEDEEITTTTKTTLSRGGGEANAGSVGHYRKGENATSGVRGQAYAAQHGRSSYDSGDEETTTTRQTTVTAGGAGAGAVASQQKQGAYGIQQQQAKRVSRHGSRGYGYEDEDETTTTTTKIATRTGNVAGIGARQNQSAIASMGRKSAAGYGYNEDDDEFTTTTKTITTTQGGGEAPPTPLHQTQGSYRAHGRGAGYGYGDEEEEETTTTKTITNDDVENILQYGRSEREDLLGQKSSVYTHQAGIHQAGIPSDNYFGRGLLSPKQPTNMEESSTRKKRPFNCFDFVFFVLAPCFIILVIIAIIITIALA